MRVLDYNMIHNVRIKAMHVNTMVHIDLNDRLLSGLKSTELAELSANWRIQGIAVYRTIRAHQSGGFGDPDKHPHVWGVAVMAGGQWRRIHNARGQGREWSNLDRLEKWLREQGIRHWQLVNDLDETGAADR
jgi:hypothetical protein